MTVSFALRTRVTVYDEENPKYGMNFSVPSNGLADWDNKPWALYSGAFTDGLAKKLMNHVKQDDYNQDFDSLHRTVPRGEGDGHRGCGGRLLLPGGRGEGDGVHRSSPHGEFRIGLQDEGCELWPDEENGQYEESGPGLAICSFGLNDGYLGRRDGKIEGVFSDEKLRRMISRLWIDFYSEDAMIYNVNPQPGDGDCSEIVGLYVIVDFLPQVDPRHFGRVPALIRARGSDIQSDFVQAHLEAAMVPERASWVELAHASGLQHQCRSRVGNQCVIRIGTELVLNELKYVIPDGALITFLYDIEEGHIPRISLLQTTYTRTTVGAVTSGPPPTSTGQILQQRISGEPGAKRQRFGHRRLQDDDGQEDEGGEEEPHRDDDEICEPVTADIILHMLHRTTDSRTIDLTLGSPSAEREQIARGWGVEVDDIIGIHPLRAIPQDLLEISRSVVTTRWVQDSELRAYPTDVQCLFDVELHGGTLGVHDFKLSRHVDWSRRLTTRDGLLQYLKIGDYCRLIANDACLVWHNDVLWASQDLETRPLQHGDYFRVAVPAKEGQTARTLHGLLRHTARQGRDHLMFDTSTEEEDSDDDYRFDESGSGATSYGQRPDVSEPEPHAALTHLYNEIYRIWHEENTGPITEVTLHGLHEERSSAVTLNFSCWDALLTIDPIWEEWLAEKDHFQVYLLHDQPQSVLPAAAHFLVEFTPREFELRDGKSPVVIERLTWTENGCPSFCWRAAYVDPWELWHGARSAALGIWWIGDYNILDPRAEPVQAGSLLTFQPGHQPSPTGGLANWPYAAQNLGSIIATRDCHPRRQYSLFVHAVGPDGNFVGTRSIRVSREHLGMPHLLLHLST